MEHVPVLLKEAVDGLAVRGGGRCVDGTFGRGGHSREIVRRGGEVLGIDRDDAAVAAAGDLRVVKGKQCTTEVQSQERYIEMLDAKLQEELSEYQKSKALEELADLLEVMGAVVRARGYTWEQLTEVRKATREKRGGFDKKILLKEVIEK